ARGCSALAATAIKILGGAKPQKAQLVFTVFLAAAVRQLVAFADETGARPVLEPAVTVTGCEHLEQITIEGRFASGSGAEEIAVALAYLRQIARQPREIGAVPAADRHLVRDTAGIERH